MTTFEYALISIGIGVVQAVIILIAHSRGWNRGFDTATCAAKQRTAVLLKELQDLRHTRSDSSRI